METKMICKNVKSCPLAIKKEGKKVVKEFCYHLMTPHDLDHGCKLPTCGHMSNEDCGCVEYVEEKPEPPKIETPNEHITRLADEVVPKLEEKKNE